MMWGVGWGDWTVHLVLAQATVEEISSCADGGAEAACSEVASCRQGGPKG